MLNVFSKISGLVSSIIPHAIVAKIIISISVMGLVASAYHFSKGYQYSQNRKLMLEQYERGVEHGIVTANEASKANAKRLESLVDVKNEESAKILKLKFETEQRKLTKENNVLFEQLQRELQNNEKLRECDVSDMPDSRYERMLRQSNRALRANTNTRELRDSI